jgi:hypothetical protein
MSSIPQFSMAFSLPAATLTISYGNATFEEIDLEAGTYRNDRTGSADDLLEYVFQQIDAESAETWSRYEPAGLPYARSAFQMQGTIDVDGFTFSDAAWSAALGYATASPFIVVTGPPVLRVSTIASTRVRAYLWTPCSADVGPLDEFTLRRQHVALSAGLPVFGERTVDVYFTGQNGVVRIFALYAASILAHYRKQAPYLAKISPDADADDPWIDWEAFAYAWLTSDHQVATFAPDRDSPSESMDIQTSIDMLVSAEAVTGPALSIAPLYYNYELPVWAAPV